VREISIREQNKIIMTQEEILEFNKRCTEFLGMYDYSKDNEYFQKGEYFCYPEKHKNPGSGYYKIGNVFINDWNWIMEVVEKIEEIGSYYIMEVKCFSSFIIEKNSIKFYYQKHGEYLLQLELIPFISEDVWKHPMFKEHIIQVFDFKNKTKKEAVVQAINQFLIFYYTIK
jgi:hypothetical protein